MLKLDLILKGKNKTVIGSMKDELGEKIITKFLGLRTKIYSYLIDDGSTDEKAKGTKKCVIKKKKFENYQNCLEATRLENKLNHLEKNKIDIDGFLFDKRNHKEFIN